jgi:hypothetical protein
LGTISQDPAKDDYNLYRYVKNSPTNREDPSGLFDEQKMGEVVKFLRPDVWKWWTEKGGRLKQGNYLVNGSAWYDFEGNLSVLLEKDYGEIDAAKKFIEVIENSFATGMQFRAARTPTPENQAGLAKFWYRKAGEAVEASVDAYLGILSITNEGLDWVITVDEIGKGNYWAAAGFLPIVAGGTIKVVDKAGEVVHIAPKATVANSTRRWKVGDPINNLTRSGNVPSWSAVRQRFWKNEALNNAGNYGASNLERMRRGLAPQRINPRTGKLESMELHHTPPQRDGGLFDVQPVWPDDHALIDPFRNT